MACGKSARENPNGERLAETPQGTRNSTNTSNNLNKNDLNAVNKIDTTHMTNAAHIGFMEQTIKRAKASATLVSTSSPAMTPR